LVIYFAKVFYNQFINLIKCRVGGKGENTMGEKISWESEFATALNRAKAEGKTILLSFHNPG
jgi:hypothetical protein